PTEKFTYNFGSLPWTELQPGLSYVSEYSFEADFDEDMSNNTLQWEFSVSGGYILRTAAISNMILYLENNYNSETLNRTVGYLPQNYLQSGARLSMSIDGTDEFEIDKPYWVGFVDFNKYGLYSHATSILMLDAKTGDIEERKGNWYPSVNGSSFGELYDLDLSRFYGDIPKGAVQKEDDFIFQINNEPANEAGNCVLLVTGKPSSLRDSSAFRASARTMRNEFTNEENGPEMSPDDIHELNNPTAEQLYNKILELSGKCSNITFYYIGHAEQSTGIDLSDFQYGFYDLLNVFCDANFTNITMLVDCCYSGQLVAELDNIDPDLKNGKNISIFTSSDGESESKLRELDYTRTDGTTLQTGIGAFTNSLVTSFGNPDIDTDGNGKTSWKEAFEDALNRNPLINEGTDHRLNDQKPQQGSFESVPEEENDKISFHQSGLNFKINSGLNTGQSFNIEVSYGSNLFGQPAEPDILEASTGRLFDIELMGHDGSDFDVDIEFPYNQFYDNFETTEGNYGVIYRESGSMAWKIHTPTEYDGQTMTFTAIGVDHFSQWALAKVEGSTSVISAEGTGIFIETYPNPFGEEFAVDVTLEKAGNVRIEIVDISGRTIKSLKAGYRPAGKYTYNFNANDFTSGFYTLKITAGTDSEIKQIINLK
ncbi:MAG: T9SS type A sorting domain-containing protein, partial [Candidatus Kapaibacterium sp.]